MLMVLFCKQVQRQALLAIGNLAFSWENRRTLVASETLREMLLRLSSGQETRVCKAAARALAILGMNVYHVFLIMFVLMFSF